MTRIGIDIGSTTVKLIALDEKSEVFFSRYSRHNAKASETVTGFLEEFMDAFGDKDCTITITGSVGMGICESSGIPFIQEVVAATKAIRHFYPEAASMIDIGGEDAKIVFFNKDGQATDLRMNGNCAGGTGAFIDQMAIILGTTVESLGELAANARQIHPIASRCGVFCKTDIQNLIAKNATKEDIAASIFHSVAVQTVTTLAHGCDIVPPVIFCGGPLSFIPALRDIFIKYMGLSQNDVIVPEHGEMLPATGAALAGKTHHENSTVADTGLIKISSAIRMIRHGMGNSKGKTGTGLRPVFMNEKEHAAWLSEKSHYGIPGAELAQGRQDAFLGIDSGSTTTKIALLDPDGRILYSYYCNNTGDPLAAVENGLEKLKEECLAAGTELNILGSCSTGYGEDLIKAAFGLDHGIVETMAHYIAAKRLDEDVSFILDIGGQDMKAIFINKGIISRIEINEACSSGCGSFIETFAKSLGYTPADFTGEACRSSSPSDLGTRCTVFMNSKVKQVLREGATIPDISAGLAYSVVKNCLYKVLKLKDNSSLGKHIVVQGGTMKNDAIVRAIEILTGDKVSRCDKPELMGAIGCAIYASEHAVTGSKTQ